MGSMIEEPEKILEEGYDRDDTQQQRLITVLHTLEREIEKQNSFKYAFLRGALYGLGTVIGATILLAFFGGVIAMTVDSLGNIPVFGELIREIVAEELRSL